MSSNPTIDKLTRPLAKQAVREMILNCVDCGDLTRRQSPLSTRCRPCHQRRRRPLDKLRYGNTTTWNKKSKRIRAEVGKCEQCSATENLTVDHIKPRCLGGGDERSNLRVLCDNCHQALTREFNRSLAGGRL